MASTSQRASRRRPSAGVDYREKKINLKERRGSPRDTDNNSGGGDGGGRPSVVDHSPNGPSTSAGGDVAPPSPARRERLRSLPAGEQRRGISEGMRVKVRFVEEAGGPTTTRGGAKGRGGKGGKKGGKGKRAKEEVEEKWFPGTIGQILNGGKKIRIHYDDGTEETTQFPDGDVCVEGLLGELLEAGGADAGEGSAGEGSNALAAGGGSEDGHVASEGGGDIDGGNNEEARASGANDDGGGSASGSGAAEGAASDGDTKQSAPSADVSEENGAEGDAGKAGEHEAAVAEASGKGEGPSAVDSSNAKPQSTPSVQQQEKPPHRLPFNQALEAALDAHHKSRTLVKSRNDPTPLPPPFLSRDEECAVRTALAFAMARARVRGRERTRAEEGEGFLAGGCGRSVPGGGRRNERPMRRARRTGGGPSSLLGGLLSPPPQRSSVGRPSTATIAGASGGLARDRRLDHVRDVLRLAVSAALPMYRGALEGGKGEATGNEKDVGSERRPCAVYDYEAAVSPAANGGGSGWDRRDRASLDGLCRHAAARLAGLRREEARRATRRGRRGAGAPAATPRGGGEGADEDRSIADGSGKGREGRSEEVDRTSMGRSDGGETVRGAIARLVRDDLLGAGAGAGGAGAEQRIERVMAVCHVLHRLLFVDSGCCLGTAVVSAICAALGDLHANRSRVRAATDDDASACGSIGGEDGESRAASRASSEGRRRGKEVRPVVPARWHAGAGGYVHGRHERRRQAVDVLSRRSGAKRVHPHEEEDDEEASSSSKKALPLPRIGDVLAANLLRLLEGAAAIRLHHRQRRVARDGGERGYELDQAASLAAAEVLAEIRAAFGGECQELLLPVRAEDAAAFYFHEKRASEGSEGKAAVLLPGGKMMLRMHLFGLTSKLALYEQA